VHVTRGVTLALSISLSHAGRIEGTSAPLRLGQRKTEAL